MLNAISLILTLFLSGANAQDIGSEPTEAVKEFKDFMMEHPNEGCPGGSRCSKKTGEMRKGWQELLKKKPRRLNQLETFRREKGIPLSVWSYGQKELADGLVQWNSPCPTHNQEEQEKIFLSEVVAPDFTAIENRKEIIIRQTVLRDGNGKFHTYPVIRGEAPLYLSQGKMIYNLDYEGDYYALAISNNGKVQLVNPIRPERFPENTTCSPDLLEAFKKLPNIPNLYQGASCTSIWDVEAKAFRTIILGWSCS